MPTLHASDRHPGIDTALLEALPLAVCLIARDGRVEAFNPVFAALFGLDAEWLDRRPTFGDLLDRMRAGRKLPEQVDFQAYREAQSRLLTGLRDVHEEVFHLPDGATLRRIAAPLGKGAVMLAFEDLSPRMSAERQAREAQAVQQSTLDNLSEAIGVFGGDGKLRLANPAFAEMWEVPDDLPKLHLSDFVRQTRCLHGPSEDWEAEAARLAAHYFARNSETSELRHEDGRVFEFVRRPLPDGSMLLRYTDVTRTVREGEALQTKAESVMALDRLKTEFLANLSFELRTPLNTVKGFAELLGGGYVGELNRRQQEYAEGIASTAAAMASTIDQVMDLANLEAGLLSLDLESLDLHVLLTGLLSLVRERARSDRIRLAFDCPPEIGWITADDRILRQALLHLLNNALAFTEPGGTVTLGAARGRDEIEIFVKDTGVGIPRSEIDFVFKGFARGADAGHEGVGLGLTLVKSFIELHGGAVNLVSRLNRGTTVTCRLPQSPS